MIRMLTLALCTLLAACTAPATTYTVMRCPAPLTVQACAQGATR